MNLNDYTRLNSQSANDELARLRAIKTARKKRVKKSDNSLGCATGSDILGNFVPSLNPYKASLDQIRSESKSEPIRRSNLTGAIMGMVEGYDYETGNFKK